MHTLQFLGNYGNANRLFLRVYDTGFIRHLNISAEISLPIKQLNFEVMS